MARTIRVADIGDYVNGQMEKLLRAAVLETDRQAKEKSPVDTGRFRLGWAIGENVAPYQGPPPGNYRGQSTPPLAVNYQFGQEKLGNVYSVHNNLPYAERLAQGWSGQASAGWVQGIAKDVQGRVRVAAAKIGRES
jgi:hypothetical protein